MWHHNKLKICSKNLWNARLVLLKDKENKWTDWADWYKIITIGEKGLLIAIAFLTAYAVVLEISVILTERTVKLTDLLLLFIYAEVLGMIAAFYKYRKIPITVPIFIAITALCRLIILQGKGINTIDLLYESGAVLLLAIAALVIRWNLINLVRPKDTDET
ncbi:phosphate-starvation-inducible PsiE family protein [Planktomarina temperata]|jgi:protein PsiE|nr:phosphate-starvation-inducible PsiE family protein [Planktomarina temperata]MDB2453695.1 phosphate-starvation-inducible PsiE family protein [Planktomarina temperata]